MQRAVNIRTVIAVIIVVAREAEATAGMSDEVMPGKIARSEAASCETLAAYSAEMLAADSTHVTGGNACYMAAAGSEAPHVTTTEATAKAAHMAATAAETTSVATSAAAARISGGSQQAQRQRSRCEYLECTSFHDLILSIDAVVAVSGHRGNSAIYETW